jgi:Bacterial Ig-like domain (group 3)/FG-GAP-like repeat
MSRKCATLTTAIAVVVMFLTPSLSAGKAFQSAVSFNSGGLYASSIAVADVNGDGKPDLLVANLCAIGGPCDYNTGNNGAIGVLLGNGDGTFQAPTTYDPGGGNAESIAVGDVNGDGKPDLVVANTCDAVSQCANGGSVGVLLGNGDGTFQKAQTYLSGGWLAWSVAVGDVNGDGKLDVLVANICSQYGGSNCHGAVGVLLGNGDGTLQAAKTYDTAGLNASSVAAADVNRDGRLDLIVADTCASPDSCDGVVAVLLGNGDGTFQPALIYPSGGFQSYSVAVGDVNGDGKPDLVAANSCVDVNHCGSGDVGVLLGNGDGTFQPAAMYGAGSSFPNSVAVEDVDGDGKLDVVLVGGTVGVLVGNGDGTFRKAASHKSGGITGKGIAVGDVNGDGRPDLLVANSTFCNHCGYGSAAVLLNSGRFKTNTSLTSIPNPSVHGQAVTLTATVTSTGSITPTGKIVFKNGSATIGSAALIGGVTTLTRKNLPVGTLSITALYKGDSESAESTSPVLLQVVNPATGSARVSHTKW